jgi:phosphatidylglycerophosphatase C
MEVTVAAFDVDNTLTVRDCVVPFMRKVAGTRSLLVSVARHPLSVLRLVMSKNRDGLKALFVSAAFAGRSVDDVSEISIHFASEIAEKWMRTDVCERLRWHQEQGHVVVLVSASLQPYLDVLGDLLEVDAVLCTRLQSEDGFYTGAFDGANCRGQEKVSRLHKWCSSANVPIEAVRFAYGDSSGDHQMLMSVDNGVLVKSIELSRVPAC